MDDARAANGSSHDHFIGCVVRSPVSSDESYMVVDGQQRITVTVLLLLYAASVTKDTKRRDELVELVTFKKGKNAHVRWTPTNIDTGQMAAVLEDLDELAKAKGGGAMGLMLAPDVVPSEAVDGPLRRALAAIDGLFTGAGSVDRRDAAVDGLLDSCRLVDLVVPRETDPTQVFASINGTGKPLEAADLIRNFVFHRFEGNFSEAEAFMQAHWSVIDERLQAFGCEGNFYLTLATKYDKDVTNESVYRVLSGRWAKKKPLAIAREVKKHLDLYLAFATNEGGWRKFRKTYGLQASWNTRLPQERRNKKFAEAMERIREVPGAADAYIYLLPLLAGLKTSASTKELNDAARSIRLVESLFVRRYLVGRQDSVRYFFKGLYADVKSNPELLRSKIFQARDGDVRGPSDAEIRKHLLERDAYSRSPFKGARYVLETHERFARGPERPCNFEELRRQFRAVDHILPKTCTEDQLKGWGISREDHERWANNIGNLMVIDSSMNSHKGAKAWTEPIKSGGSETPRDLYKDANYYYRPKTLGRRNETWTIAKIRGRSKTLADFVVDGEHGWPAFGPE